MTAKLSEDLVEELERAGDKPLQVEYPRNHKLYLIIAEDRFPIGDTDRSSSGGNGDWTDDRKLARYSSWRIVDEESQRAVPK